MSDETKEAKTPTTLGRPATQFSSRIPQADRSLRPDFENNLAEFELEFFECVADTDPSFELELLHNNPTTIPEAERPDRSTDAMHPASKEELDLPLRLTGPKVINGDIFGNEVILESEIRVKGCVYGRNSVMIGASCVIEGSVVSGHSLQIKAGSRVEGAVIGEDVQLFGPIQVEGPVFSRQALTSQGRLEAQILYAAGPITLIGNPAQDQIRVEAGLIMSKTGEIESELPIWLAEVEARPDQQKFYLSRNPDGEIQLTRVAEAANQIGPGQSTIITSLTDAALEKLVVEVMASMEN